VADDSAGEKTEEASDRKIERYREEGRVATSRELVAALTMAAGVIGGIFAAPEILRGIVSVARTSFTRATTGELTTSSAATIVLGVLTELGPGIVGFLGPAVVVGAVAGLGLTRFNFSFTPLEPKPERLDPVANFQSQLLSATPWVSLAKSLAIGIVIAWAVYSAVIEELDVLPSAAAWTPSMQLGYLGYMARLVFERAIPVTILIGIGDFAYQTWKLNQDMMMTRQEVKQEHKDMEGDPLVRARRRQRARQIMARRQLADVPKADVVVTNPTHYAVALRYRKEENAAPLILARGADSVALQIRTIASRNDIPIVENQALARALYAKGKVGAPVPKEFYPPVARVLAAIYRRKKVEPKPSQPK
jgi:flagellar biosynthesis protein FlhB